MEEPTPTPPTHPVLRESVQNRVQEIGQEIFRTAQADKESLWEKDFWMGKMLDIALANAAFKTKMFHLVDAFPTLTTDKLVVDHLKAMFSPDGAEQTALPNWIVSSVLGEGLVRGVASKIAARTLRRNILYMARQFILAESLEEVPKAMARLQAEGYGTTVDLLGEKAQNHKEAQQYQKRYLDLVELLGTVWEKGPEVSFKDPYKELTRPNISVKPTSVCSRLKPVDFEGSVVLLKDQLRPIFQNAVGKGVFVYLDMETIRTRDLTFQAFQELLSEPELADADHFGIVFQSYLLDSHPALERFIEWCEERGKRYTVRLVKGAYWDYETVLADQMGWPSPVYRNKANTDANFEACLQLLMSRHQSVRLALGSHNLRGIALTLALAENLGVPAESFEFQLLYGMGEPLKKALHSMGHPIRIYTPIGDMLEGMAYLVRRLLENTSNESFLRRQFAEKEQAETLLAPPRIIVETEQEAEPRQSFMRLPDQNGLPFKNASLLDFTLPENREGMRMAIDRVRENLPMEALPRIGGTRLETARHKSVWNPADTNQVLGRIGLADLQQAENAVKTANKARQGWAETQSHERAAVLRKAADLYLARRFDLCALMVLEVGKSWDEADADVVEAVDFLNFYALEMERLSPAQLTQHLPGEENRTLYQPRGVAVVIAPWNFPLAISTGMTSAALVSGNTVIYKPAESSSLTGQAMTELLYEAGIPDDVLTFLPGLGEEVGAHLAAHPQVDMVVFTGSRNVGLNLIREAGNTKPGQRGVKKVVAEMGGKNAIIVDEDADLDEVIKGVAHSAFGFQGQKCSACSRLIVMESIVERLMGRLAGAVEDIRVGPPENPANDMGPLIDAEALEKVRRYTNLGDQEGQVLARGPTVPTEGHYITPRIYGGIQPDSPLAQEEIFGPLVVLLPARDFDHALELANGTEFALTGGVYSRNPAHLEQAKREYRVGNLYLNRNITGAIVQRQPFGGFAMSGVGSKAGGQDYLQQFMEPRTITENTLRQGFAPPVKNNDEER